MGEGENVRGGEMGFFAQTSVTTLDTPLQNPISLVLCQLSTAKMTTVNCQLSTVNCQLYLTVVARRPQIVTMSLQCFTLGLSLWMSRRYRQPPQ